MSRAGEVSVHKDEMSGRYFVFVTVRNKPNEHWPKPRLHWENVGAKGSYSSEIAALRAAVRLS